MAKRHLSQELVSLIHHVELNESGWWKKAFAQLIQAVLWDDSSPRTPAQVRQLVDDGFGVRVPLDVVETQLESLIGKGSVRRRGDSFVLSERCRADLCASQEKAVKQRQGCQEAFLDECKKNCPSLDAEQAWLTFSSALAEAVRVAGANFYELLSGGCLKREQDWVEQVLAKVPSDSHDGLHKTFASFFAPKNQACRQEVLRLMSAHFFAEATQLSPETLQAIEQAGRAKKVLKVVLDTNFIFSVLHLHENPANDAVLSLLSLAREGAKHIDVKLQVLPSTLMEAQTSLAAMQKKVKHFRVTRAMARAASDQPVPSVVKKFLDAAARTPGLSAEAYFKPYVEDLRTVLHAKGITILEAHPAVYNVRQDVINDVLEQTQREDAEYPEHRRKGYEKWLHDVVLWHAVNDKRSATDSPLDADYWVVSIDWRFLGFDRYKRAQKASPLPVVLYPTSLMQLAQFWVRIPAHRDRPFRHRDRAIRSNVTAHSGGS